MPSPSCPLRCLRCKDNIFTAVLKTEEKGPQKGTSRFLSLQLLRNCFFSLWIQRREFLNLRVRTPITLVALTLFRRSITCEITFILAKHLRHVSTWTTSRVTNCSVQLTCPLYWSFSCISIFSVTRCLCGEHKNTATISRDTILSLASYETNPFCTTRKKNRILKSLQQRRFLASSPLPGL